MRGDLLQQMEAVVALRVAVDHARAEQESLVLELLVERGLARAERADAEDRRVAVAVGALAQAQPHRTSRPGQGATEVKAAGRAHPMSRGRHHRRDLLGRERVLIAEHARALARQVLKEQLHLLADRAVQADLAVSAAGSVHALLQPALALRTKRDREAGAQQRRSAGALQVGEQLPRLLAALQAALGDPLLTVCLRARDLVGVLDAATRDPQRELVRQKTRVQREIDIEGQPLDRREHQLRSSAGEAHALWQRAEHKMRLPALPQLRLHPQRPRMAVHHTVHPPQHVGLQRREHSLAVALEGQRPRLVQPLDLGLPEAAAEGATHQPLQLNAPGRPHRQIGGQQVVDAIDAHLRALQLRGAQQPAAPGAKCPAQRRGPIPRTPLSQAGEVAGDIALRGAQADQQEQDRLAGTCLRQQAVLGPPV